MQALFGGTVHTKYRGTVSFHKYKRNWYHISTEDRAPESDVVNIRRVGEAY